MKKIIIKIVGIILIGIFLVQGNIVLAESKTELENQQKQNSDKIKETEKQLNGIKEEKSEAMKQVEELTTKISEYQIQIDELDGKISDLNTKISEEEEKLNQAQEDYEKQKKLLEARLVASYEYGETTYLDVLLSSEGITDFLSRYYLVTEVATNDTDLLQKIEKKQKDIEQTKSDLENSKKELATSKASKQSASTQLKNSKKEKDSYVEKLSEDEKQTQAKIEQLQADNDKIEKELKIAEERYRQQLEELQRRQNDEKTNSGNGSGVLQRPVKSNTITTKMYYSTGKYHGALDYGVPVGTTVYAAADGVVYTVGSLSGSYGNYIVIQHVNGLRTWYAHGNGVFYVTPGQTVSKGQAIMQSGNSGNSSGPHLHFEVRVSPYTWYSNGNDSRRDPRNYM